MAFPTDSTLCDVLEWDSALFNYRIARLRSARCIGAEARLLPAECAARSIDCVYVLIDLADTESVESLRRLQATMVDVRVTLERCVDSSRELKCPESVRPFREADLPSLREMSRRRATRIRASTIGISQPIGARGGTRSGLKRSARDLLTSFWSGAEPPPMRRLVTSPAITMGPSDELACSRSARITARWESGNPCYRR
jgi:hypothetical protein